MEDFIVLYDGSFRFSPLSFETVNLIRYTGLTGAEGCRKVKEKKLLTAPSLREGYRKIYA
jgi:hypothetical protein